MGKRRTMLPAMEWWERLGRAIAARGIPPETVAERARVHIKSLYGYLKGGVKQPRGDVIKRLAAAVGMTEIALKYGTNGLPGNTVGLKKIPLLDMNKLGTLKVGQDPMAVWDGASVVSVPDENPDGAYAVRLVDDSGGDIFKKGDMVICDPAADVEPGSYVVAVLTDEERAHFAKWKPLAHRDTKRFTLIHGNTNYPDIEVGTKVKGFILARAVSHIRKI